MPTLLVPLGSWDSRQILVPQIQSQSTEQFTLSSKCVIVSDAILPSSLSLVLFVVLIADQLDGFTAPNFKITWNDKF
jgi:hypothetical protein